MPATECPLQSSS